ncbi:MAG TPA: hypothetical protein PLI72_09190 [Smithellaceae bacterium]|nr:hypothetical protein [Smithellaceae bacterium]
MADDLKYNPPTDQNNGYYNLMQDLTELLRDVKNYEFDDFKNLKYATPKIALRNRLAKISENVINGKYDN